MVSPRTPQNIVRERYGPSGVRTNGGRTRGVVRKRVPGVGLGIERGGPEGYNPDYVESDDEDNSVNNTIYPSEDELVRRALAAYRRAEDRGDGIVEMEEREWKAWQRRQAMEREIERRVQLRLKELERRKRVVVPVLSHSASSQQLTLTSKSKSTRMDEATLAIPGSFQSLGSQSNTALAVPPKVPPKLPADPPPQSSEYPERSRIPDVAPTIPPPTFEAIANQNQLNELLQPPPTPPRSVASTTSPHSQQSPLQGFLAPQPGSSYHPGLHPSLAAARSAPNLRSQSTTASSSGTPPSPGTRRRRFGAPLR